MPYPHLSHLSCYNNQLSSLDISKNTKITVLSCYNNQLSSLDVSSNTVLGLLDCHNNRLKSLDVTKNAALRYLICERNQITKLNVSNCPTLAALVGPDNRKTDTTNGYDHWTDGGVLRVDRTVKVIAGSTISGITYQLDGTSAVVTAPVKKNAKKLTSVTIGKNIKTIGKNAFNGCKNLKKITIKTTNLTKKSVGANAFKGIYKKAVIKCPKSKKTA